MSENFLSQMLLAEFNNEMKTTRKILERVPFDKFDWVPHAKSMSLGRLAVHVATISGLGADIIAKDVLIFDGTNHPPVVKSTDDIVALFKERSGATRAAIDATTDDILTKPWKMMFKNSETERIIFEGSRAAAF